MFSGVSIDAKSDSSICQYLKSKCESLLTMDERWDQLLTSTDNMINVWRAEKTGIGPEPQLVPDVGENTAEATLYADDNSVGEVAINVEELKLKTEMMLNRIISHMRSSQLLINADKTRVMLFAISQKRSKNNLEFHLDIEGNRIKEVESATLLGLTLTNNFTWDQHIDKTIGKCSKRLNGLYRVQKELNVQQKKELAEGAIVSLLMYGLEVVSSGSESVVRKLEGMHSKAARFILSRSRKEWSRTEGYSELNWITIPQLAVESSLRLFFKILWNKSPRKLYESIFDEPNNEVTVLSVSDIEMMTKLSRKSWKIRVLRYSKVVPNEQYLLDLTTSIFKRFLKSWVKYTIPKERDRIFQGRISKKEDWENDWLSLELNDWKSREREDVEAQIEADRYS